MDLAAAAVTVGESLRVVPELADSARAAVVVEEKQGVAWRWEDWALVAAMGET